MSNNFNSPVLTYKLNSLMIEVLATTETCLNMDWLHEDYRSLSVSCISPEPASNFRQIPALCCFCRTEN